MSSQEGESNQSANQSTYEAKEHTRPLIILLPRLVMQIFSPLSKTLNHSRRYVTAHRIASCRFYRSLVDKRTSGHARVKTISHIKAKGSRPTRSNVICIAIRENHRASVHWYAGDKNAWDSKNIYKACGVLNRALKAVMCERHTSLFASLFEIKLVFWRFNTCYLMSWSQVNNTAQGWND